MNDTKVIISLTSFSKERLANVPYYLYHSFLKYRYDYVKIVLTLWKDDISNMPDILKRMIDDGVVELLIADKDLKCNLKYFYCMKKYRDLPIITVDDDSIYPEKMIPDLLELHAKYPNYILARSARIIDNTRSYRYWRGAINGVIKPEFADGYVNQPRTDLLPEGYGGVLYPPNILEITDDLISEMSDFFRADDVYLVVLERRKNLKVFAPTYNYNKVDFNTRPIHSLCLRPDNISMIDSLVKKYL